MKITQKIWPALLISLTCGARSPPATDAPPAPAPAASQPAPTNERPAKEFEKEWLGVTLVADVLLDRIDHFRTLGMKRGFGQDQPLCDFIATAKWVGKHGDSIKAGEKFKIGKVTLVEATDGFGNTGTKLILDSAEPKEGLVFYCYAYNRGERAYWAIDKAQVQKALKGYFHVEEPGKAAGE